MKKFISYILAITLVLSIFALPASAAGNIRDTYENYPKGTLWENVYTPYRGKWDSTSCYIRNQAFSTSDLLCWVHRYDHDTYPDKAGDESLPPVSTTVDRYYGSSLVFHGSYYLAAKNVKTVEPGQSVYLPNYVREDGYGAAAIGAWPSAMTSSFEFAWSPDSV